MISATWDRDDKKNYEYINSIVGVDRENLVGSKAKIYESSEKIIVPSGTFRGRIQRPGEIMR